MAPSTKETLLARLAEQVDTLTTSEGWQHWLTIAGRFAKYSLRNQLLILAQRPDASLVGGYRFWQEQGRQVRKGEQGIAILAPLVRRPKDDEPKVEDERVTVRFRVVYVFDVAQTDGEPVPNLELPAIEVTGDGLLDRLIGVAEAAGRSVTFVDSAPSGVRGWWEAETMTITLVSGYPSSSQVRTLLHELAHSVDETEDGDTRPVREVIAESVAWLVGTTTLGIDLGPASTVYLASWGGSSERMQVLAGRVLDRTQRLEHLLDRMAVTA